MTISHVTEHFHRYLGEPGQVETLDRGVGLYRCERPEYVTFTTMGLSTLPIGAIYPQELVCSVQHQQDGAAAYLVKTMFDMILEQDRGPTDNQIISATQPILNRTHITGILVSSHPYLDDEFNVIMDQQQKVLAEIMTLIPINASEATRATTNGIEALLSHLEAVDPPLLDVTRPLT